MGFIGQNGEVKLLRFLLVFALAAGCGASAVSSSASSSASSPEATDPQAAHSVHAEHSGHDRHAPGHHGRHHPFPAEHYAPIFEEESRAEWQRPDAIVDALQITAGSRVADIGAGSGYFAFRFATAVGAEGIVYGVDIEPSMVAYMTERAQREQVANLRPITATLTSPELPELVDLIFVCNTWHHIGETAERLAYAQTLSQNLRPGGRIVLVEWRAGLDIPIHSPPEAMRVPKADLIAEIQGAGLTLTQDLAELLPYQDVLVFTVSE